MRAGVFTIVAKNYLALARVLMASVREHSPDLKRFVVLVDRVDGYFDPDAENFEVVRSEELGIPNSEWFHFKYTILELSTAVKPYAMEFLLRRFHLDQIIYLDPDIRLYHSLQPISDRLENGSLIVLTPHLNGPLDDDHRPNDRDVLQSGAYNLGFVALRSAPEAFEFLSWWQSKLYDGCYVDFASGLFVDQRWIDLVPSLFRGVLIERSPAYNVAYWNLAHRTVARVSQRWMVNGEPLRFFHFSGLDAANPEALSRHQTRFRLSELGDVSLLVHDYLAAIEAAGSDGTRSWPYAFGRFANGVRIPDWGRRTHRHTPQLLAIRDPFSNEGFDALARVWNEPVSAQPALSHFALESYLASPELRTQMPDIFSGDLVRFLRWFVSVGKRIQKIDERFLAPAYDALGAAEKQQADGAPKQGASEPGWSKTIRLTEMEKAIYTSRPDLQRIFPDPCGRDAAKFVAWMLTAGAREYGLGDLYLKPVRDQWRSVLAAAGSAPTRWWHSATLTGMDLSVWLRSAIRSGRKRFRRLGPRSGRKKAGQRAMAASAEGVNLFGYLNTETGVGEAARMAAVALSEAGVQVSHCAIPVSTATIERDLDQIAAPHGTNLFFVNADQTEPVLDGVGAARLEGRLNVGCWAWELEHFPERWRGAFSPYDEIWAASSFAAAAISRIAPIPVLPIPYAVWPEVPEGVGREQFGLPAEEFIFLTMFDVLSVVERKNPLATVEAFTRAFVGTRRERLVVKVNHAGAKPEIIAALRERASGYPVTVLDQTMSRTDTNALLAASDCLVSLHRSEGFGLPLAEAMFLGKPVIATAYSGNMDFTKPENSFLVSYRMVRIGPGCSPYDADQQWADPDRDEAASMMRLVAESPELRQTRAADGRSFVREHFSPEAVGVRMEQRIAIAKRSKTRLRG